MRARPWVGEDVDERCAGQPRGSSAPAERDPEPEARPDSMERVPAHRGDRARGDRAAQAGVAVGEIPAPEAKEASALSGAREPLIYVITPFRASMRATPGASDPDASSSARSRSVPSC